MIVFICCSALCWVEGEAVLEMRVAQCRGTAVARGIVAADTSRGSSSGALRRGDRAGAPPLQGCPRPPLPGLACILHPTAANKHGASSETELYSLIRS